jgi:hypothetical protein
MAEQYMILDEKEKLDPSPRLSGSDCDRIDWLLQYGWASQEERTRGYFLAVRVTKALVSKALVWIEAVAIELYVKGRLTGDEVRQVLEAHGFNAPGNALASFRNDVWDTSMAEQAIAA